MSQREPFFVEPDEAPAKREALKAALHLFAHQGVDGTSVRDIGARAGYTNPALFKHFEGKDDLVRQLFERCYRRLADEASAAIVAGRPFRENLRQLVERYLRLAEESPEAVLFVQDNLRVLWPQVAPALRRHSLMGLLRRLIDDGRRQGAIPSDLAPDLLVNAALGVLAQFSRASHFGELPGDTETWTQPVTELLERMVGARK